MSYDQDRRPIADHLDARTASGRTVAEVIRAKHGSRPPARDDEPRPRGAGR